MSSSQSKRDLVLGLLDPTTKPRGVPAAFFLHFNPAFHRGRAAVDKHLEYFRATGMDLLKIQYEHPLPAMPELERPSDWSKVPRRTEEFYRDPLEVVSGLVAGAGRDALVVVTLYSPFMLAAQISGAQRLVQHLEEDPEQVRKGFEIVTESMLTFVRGCIGRGVDGFYASTQGAEAGRFQTPGVFDRYVKPFDRAVWDVIRGACPANILHICDYHGVYDGFERFRDYPGQIVSAGLKLAGGTLTAREASRILGRPFMGGLDRHGVIAKGPVDAIRREVEKVLEAAPERFILAADCTVPSDTPWSHLKAAIDTAHAWSAGGSR